MISFFFFFFNESKTLSTPLTFAAFPSTENDTENKHQAKDTNS